MRSRGDRRRRTYDGHSWHKAEDKRRIDDATRVILTLICLAVLAIVVFVIVDGCTTCTFSYCPAHANLCDPNDFDPKCVIDDCRGARGGPDDAGIR